MKLIRIGIYVILALVSFAGMTLNPALATSIYWDQIQSFTLSGHPDPLVRYENGSWSGIPFYSQSSTLTFQGAPPASFMLEGHQYSLTAGSFILSSNFYAKYGVGAYDSDWLSDASVTGSITTLVGASAPFARLVNEWSPSGELAASATDQWLLPIAWLLGEEWGNFGQASVGTQTEVNKPINTTWSFGPENFLHNEDITVYLNKLVYLNLTGFIPDDNWDAVASAINNWQGTMTLRYIYEESPSPVPLPSSGLLFLSGLGIMALSRRCKRAIFMTVLTLLLVAGMLSVSPAATDTMTWVQSKTFSLADIAALCEWTGSWATARPSSWAHQEDPFSFQGAPQEFLRLGSRYKLTQIKFELDSTFTGNYHLHAYEFQWYRTCGATGSSSTSVTAFLDMPPYAGFFGSSNLGEPLAKTAFAYGKEIYGDWTWLGSSADDYAAPVIEIDADFTIEPSLFPTFDKLKIPFKLSKDIRIDLVTWQEDDESDYMSNEVNKWEGTVTLTYTYTKVPPVPAPAAFWLLLSD